ncbi:hypothetical protein VB711_16325 [Cronbergia sp. UHCC 0137]|uniref:hypothetical protein n=1 Tax=Cronbergia sp. UHCC 0137 TaxID=3110239 RepID=UPI002B2182D5|nr:hypothetical protein [Cronbergia sp. UHCC 0137]MEA5619396.1 hypothetical protein [Cronbergia sp. UHCC 0137]
MNQPTSTINTKLLDSLAQIILSLSQEEYQILIKKIQPSSLTSQQKQQYFISLKQDIAAGIEQLEKGEYTEYDENSLPSLLTSIKARGRQRLEEELSQ